MSQEPSVDSSTPWSIRDVGRVLGVTRHKVMNEIVSGELRAVRIGRLWRVELPVLQRYMKAKGFTVIPGMPHDSPERPARG